MEFEFRVFTKRWNHTVTYHITKTVDGWSVKHIAINGNCNPDGSPLLHANLNQDNISYPYQIDSFLEHLWQQIHLEEIDHETAQIRLQEIADWISNCEKAQPKWPGWNC